LDTTYKILTQLQVLAIELAIIRLYIEDKKIKFMPAVFFTFLYTAWWWRLNSWNKQLKLCLNAGCVWGTYVWFTVLLLLSCLTQAGTYSTTCTSDMGCVFYSSKLNLCYLYKMRKNKELYCYLCHINSLSCLRHVIPAKFNLLPCNSLEYSFCILVCHNCVNNIAVLSSSLTVSALHSLMYGHHILM